MKVQSLFLLLFVVACSSSESNSTNTSEKGPNLRLEKEYENVKSLANAVKAGVIDSCLTHQKLTFEEMIKMTPKMSQMMKHGNYTVKTCNFVNEKIGEISSWNLYEAFKSKDHLLNIFRYKLQSKRYDFDIELRITFTDSNKLTEYRFFKWEEVYSEDLILMNWH